MSASFLRSGTLLAHYTSLKSAIAIIESGTIRLNPMSRMNDPKETTSWVLDVELPSNRDILFNDRCAGDKISRQCREIAKLACFSMDSSTDIDSPVLHHARYGELGRCFANAPMWNHYAEKHQGVCLVFEKSSLKRCIVTQLGKSFVHMGAVDYKDEPYIVNRWNYAYCFSADSYLHLGLEAYSDLFVRSACQEIFFTKQKDWSYEREFRVLAIDQMEGPVSFRFGNSLRYVILGAEFFKGDDSELSVNCSRLSELALGRFGIDELEFKNHILRIKQNL